jgi:hypothetical protein
LLENIRLGRILLTPTTTLAYFIEAVLYCGIALKRITVILTTVILNFFSSPRVGQSKLECLTLESFFGQDRHLLVR